MGYLIRIRTTTSTSAWLYDLGQPKGGKKVPKVEAREPLK